ncbi:MAG TPA: amidohydrolase family protein, partial [Verrucomicrobiae bacterium]|nr:amidohydrolase family protein [Verrucomicrobiae bacterium]
MRPRLLTWAFAALLITGVRIDDCGAQDFILSGATVHTVSGETLAPGMVRVRQGKIAQVAREVSSDGPVIDANGLHLYPGLVAANTTLGLLEINSVRASLDTVEVGAYTPDVRSWLAVNPDSELIPVARANGVAYFQPVPFGGLVCGQSGVMTTIGWTIEGMRFQAPVALHLDWPEMGLNLTPKEEFADKSKWKSPEDQANERRARLKEIDDFFLEAEAYAKGRATDPDGKRLVPAWEAMLPFLRGEIPLMVHADDARQIKAAVAWAEARNYKIILAGGRDAWRVAELLAERKVPVIYDHVFTLPPRDTAPYDVQFTAPAVLHRAGVQVSFSQGGRFEATSLRNLPYAAAQAVAFGLPADEALKGLTLYPAGLLGVADRVGSIEAGKEATFFLADGDILDIRSQVKRMWIAGSEVSLESRHTRLYEKFRNRPKG